MKILEKSRSSYPGNLLKAFGVFNVDPFAVYLQDAFPVETGEGVNNVFGGAAGEFGQFLAGKVQVEFMAPVNGG
jgi:hypothetical protein